MSKHNDENWLRKKYVEEGLSEREIADLVPVSRSTVRRRLNEYDIERRPSPSEKPPQFLTASNGYEVIISEVDGVTRTVGVHQLLAIADGADPEKVFSGGEYQVHHENGVSWFNVHDNLTLHTVEEHMRLENEKVTDEEIAEATASMSQFYAAELLDVSQPTISRRVNQMWERNEA